jgi:hypothetical protein
LDQNTDLIEIAHDRLGGDTHHSLRTGKYHINATYLSKPELQRSVSCTLILASMQVYGIDMMRWRNKQGLAVDMPSDYMFLLLM